MRFARTASGYIRCLDLIEFLYAYLDDELTAEEQREFERHLAVCSACRNYLASYRKTIALEGAAAAELEGEVAAMPEDLIAAIVASLRDSARP